MKPALLFVLATTAFIAGCANQATSPGPTPQSTFFPASIGTTWVYATTDSSANAGVKHDTVTVTITGTYTLPSGQFAQVWTLTSPAMGNTHDTWFVVPTDSLFTFYAADETTVKWHVYIPPHIGDAHGNWQDSTSVVTMGTLFIPAGKFENVFDEYQFHGTIDNSSEDHVWIQSGMGIPLITSRGGYVLMPRVSQWVLLSHAIG